MSRTELTRHSRNFFRRSRAIWLALAATGLATAAFAGVDFAEKSDAAAMKRAITRQRVAAGLQAQARVRQDTPLTVDQMLSATASYEGDMTKAIEHGESLRVQAYRSKDIIRMTCVDEKLGQMKEILAIAKPRFATIKEAVHDELGIRGQFNTIREGWERINQLGADMESCMGDVLDSVVIGRLGEEEPGPGAAIDDPTLPPNATRDVDRPAAASPYR